MKGNHPESFYWNSYRSGQGCDQKFYSPARSVTEMLSTCPHFIKSVCNDIQQKLYKYQKQVPGEVYQKLLDILLIDNRIKMKKVIMDLPSQSSSFIEFAQYALLDFTLNLLKPGNFSTKSDERSIFCEVYIPLFKAFGNCLGVLKKLNLENLGLLPVPENQTVAHCLP